jgi:predicted transposase YdaD
LHIDGVIASNSIKAKIYFIVIHFRREEIYSKLFSEIFIYLKQKRPKNDWMMVVIYPSRNMDLGVTKHY